LAAPFGDGIHLVGLDIAPGVYRKTDETGFCSWARLSSLTGEFTAHIEDRFSVEGDDVVIAASDTAFETSGCGMWEPVG
jgi:hypothetical protein